MKKNTAALLKTVILIILASALAAALLSGCRSAKESEDLKRDALRYYQKKYGLKDVTVTDSFKAGNPGLFGYISVTDMAYVMSDGNSVYWNDTDKTFSDSAQANEINRAFRLNVLAPALTVYTSPLKMTDCSLNRTDMESFDECVFTAYYDGDVEAFLRKEKPEISGLTVAVQTDDRDTCGKETEAFYGSLNGLVTGWTEVFMLSEGLDGLTGSSWYPDWHGTNVTGKAYLDFRQDHKEEIRWYLQNYVEIYGGIRVTSTKYGFVLGGGDVALEQIGTCADLQKIIDEAYEALPVDAEENKNGGYMKKDRRHESRAVIDDPSLPLYRIRMSQRVTDALDSYGRLSVFVIDSRDGDAQPLMMYYGKDTTAAFTLYRVRGGEPGRGEYTDLSPDYLYFFGTCHYEPYGGETGTD